VCLRECICVCVCVYAYGTRPSTIALYPLLAQESLTGGLLPQPQPHVQQTLLHLHPSSFQGTSTPPQPNPTPGSSHTLHPSLRPDPLAAPVSLTTSSSLLGGPGASLPPLPPNQGLGRPLSPSWPLEGPHVPSSSPWAGTLLRHMSPPPHLFASTGSRPTSRRPSNASGDGNLGTMAPPPLVPPAAPPALPQTAHHHHLQQPLQQQQQQPQQQPHHHDLQQQQQPQQQGVRRAREEEEGERLGEPAPKRHAPVSCVAL